MKRIHCFIKRYEDQISNTVFVAGLLGIAVAAYFIFTSPRMPCHVSASDMVKCHIAIKTHPITSDDFSIFAGILPEFRLFLCRNEINALSLTDAN